MNFFDVNMQALEKRDPALRAYLGGFTHGKGADETWAMAKDAFRYIAMGKQGVVAIMGFGSGKLAMTAFKKMGPGHALIIYEPEISKFLYALERADFSALWSSQQVVLLLGKVEDYGFVYFFHEKMLNGNLWLLKNKRAIEGASEEADKDYSTFYARFVEEKKFWDTNVGTQINIGKDFINSIVENIPSIIDSQGIGELAGMFRGVPSVVVSSGPSLDGSLESLQKAKGKAIIIAVDTALPILMEHGIEPDFVCGIDPLGDNAVLFKDGYRGPFVAMAQYTPEVLRALKEQGNRVFISEMMSNPVYQWLHWFWEPKGDVECFGGSVSHFGLSLAEHMGSGRIALIGQDLCFTGKMHAGDITKKLHDYMGLEVPDETVGAIEMENIKGEKVYTKQTFLSFKTAFENKIRHTPGIDVVNCTESGVRIEGMREVPLGEFLSLHGVPVDVEGKLRSLQRHAPGYKLEGLVDRLEAGVRLLKRIQRVTLWILKLIHRCVGARQAKNNREARKLTAKIEQLRPRTQHPLLSIIAAYHYHLELYLRRQEIQDIDRIKDKWKRFDLQLDRGLNFYGELDEAIGLFLKAIIPVKDALKKRMASDGEHTGQSLGGNLESGAGTQGA